MYSHSQVCDLVVVFTQKLRALENEILFSFSISKCECVRTSFADEIKGVDLLGE